MVESHHFPEKASPPVSTMSRVTAPVRNLGWRLAIWFKFEAIIEAQWSENIVDAGRPDI